MKVLIVSDTHGNNTNYLNAVKKEKPFDLVIHCGDTDGSEYTISKAAECPTEIVLGNNDFFSYLPKEREIEIEGYRIWITHGHNYYVSMNNEIIKEEAKERGMDIVVYGHTHKPVIDIEKNIIAVNPGSLTYPRQEGKKPSYMIMQIAKNKAPEFAIKYL